MDPYILGAIGTGGGALIDQYSASIKNQKKLLEIQEEMNRQLAEYQRNLNQQAKDESDHNERIAYLEKKKREENEIITQRRAILFETPPIDNLGTKNSDPMYLLKIRFINGEISEEEYLHMKKILEK
ncbi:hypothetical protein KHC33_04125 [Methanospirillum sp. J.3.6.1-F.2.7.3]|uniref:SHOCT domain-containing protein n=1 Tax=Methanospirillum purgamenti TaxID=2834276 RepID=A0A8E7AZL2_9EURY|nr:MULTISPECIES: hypothetical protein [Methanospirillum]MDX8551772.1 hypothetical protein [Methanospirillum hungatei]QVV89710.1 hypothetical protein KHC33_04125 [Methanospirillum sp. J.3.6.1-F.2.7.3]